MNSHQDNPSLSYFWVVGECILYLFFLLIEKVESTRISGKKTPNKDHISYLDTNLFINLDYKGQMNYQ